MAPPPPSTSDAHAPPRRTLKSTLIAGVAALLPLGLVGLLAGIHEPSTRSPPRATTPAPTSMPAPSTRSSSEVASSSEVHAAPSPPSTTVPAPALADEPGDTASRPTPQAGRQVLRCTERGRITYRDLQAGCPDGVGEAVTVFPTQGVEKFQ